MSNSLKSRKWWGYVSEDLQELFGESNLLIDIFNNMDLVEAQGVREFHDYSFIVFPAAKGFEGFLKTLFKDMGFISEGEFFSKRFRIGKALNPALERELGARESVYDKLVDFCQGKKLSDELWETWQSGRNSLFHWFPNEKNAVDFTEAKRIVDKILNAMDLAFEECKLNKYQ